MKRLRRLYCRVFGHNEDILEPRCNFCEQELEPEVLKDRRIAWDRLLASPLADQPQVRNRVRVVTAAPAPRFPLQRTWDRSGIYASI